MNVREAATKTIPKSAPEWARKSPITTLTTVISTLAGVVAIAAWLGLKPPTVLAANEAYVTHEQFNLLLINLVDSVKDLEQGLKEVEQNLNDLTELSMMLDAAPAASAPAPVVRPNSNSAAELLGITEPEPEAIVIPEAEVVTRPPEPDLGVKAKKRLEAAKEKIEMLQMEQRTIR